MLYPLIVSSYEGKNFILEFKDAVVVLDPETHNSAYSILKETSKPINIIFTADNNIELIIELSESFRVIAPSSTHLANSLVSTYPDEKAIFISKSVIGYFINPPTLTKSLRPQRFILLTTQQLEVLYVPRITYVEDPPPIDAILTFDRILKKAENISKTPDKIPRFIGGEPQWCIAISKKDTVAPPVVYINKKKYAVYRHMLEVVIREIE